MRRLLLASLVLLLLPLSATAQQIDTLTVYVARSISHIKITVSPSVRGFPGDTLILQALGIDSATADTVPISVEWDQVGPDTVLEITPLTTSTARGVILPGTRGKRGHITIRLLTVDSMTIGYLEHGTRQFLYAATNPADVAVGDTLRFCAVAHLSNGSVAVGSVPECLDEYRIAQLAQFLGVRKPMRLGVLDDAGQWVRRGDGFGRVWRFGGLRGEIPVTVNVS